MRIPRTATQPADRRRTATGPPTGHPTQPNPTPTLTLTLTPTLTPNPAPASAPAPVPELLAALIPFVNGTTLGISQTLYKTLYRVHTAHLRGHDPAEHIAKLTSLNPDRIKIPDTDEGRRLRAPSVRSAPPGIRTCSRNGLVPPRGGGPCAPARENPHPQP
ncbi:hypothetical protein ACWLMY_37475 [Streptomyces anulatus]